MSNLALSLLGPPRIECDGVPVHVPRHKAVALLAYLAVTGQTHRRDALATLLWPEHDQRRARAGLRRALAALKGALGEGWLDAERETVGLDCDAQIELDVRAFRARLAGCRAHEHPPQEVCPACLSLLAEAAALYRGDFMAGFTLRDSPAFDDWQFFQTQGLRDELAGALERLAQGHSARGEFEPAIVYARRWLSLDPLHEAAHHRLMELYAWSGQRAAALRQYEECERILQEELGAPPEEETVALYQAIVAHRERPSPVDRDGAPPSVETAVPRRHNLPAQLIPFVGREAVLDAIGERLCDPDCRLLTLVGPGGSGKTRLALEAAARQTDRYRHGVFFVSLAPLRSAESIVPTIAQSLGFIFHGEGEPKAQLLSYLRGKSVLLVLDNYEHLLAGAELVPEILQAAPEVVVLATSRAGLHVQGEQRFPVEGMAYPDQTSEVCQTSDVLGHYSAVKLFLQSARRAQPNFELTAEVLPDVARICHLVEGMPLGILLAAAWVALFSPAEIAAEIERGLDFLESDLRDVPDRQRSLRAAFDHSWNLLSEGERETFAALSVFRGGFTREAAQQVTSASPRALMALADKSLLHRTVVPSLTLRTGGRYEVHELLRQYAVEKLAASPGAEQQVHDRHCAFYAAALQRWDAELKGPGQLAALAEVEADIANARAAWDWAVERGKVQELDRAMDGLCRFYEWRGRYEEGDDACRLEPAGDDRGAPSPGTGAQVRAIAMAWRGAFNRGLRRLEQGGQLLRESLACLEALASAGWEVRRERAFALWQMGYVLYDLGAYEEARQRYEESLASYRALDDRWGMASVLCPLGDLICMSGAPGEAEALVREGLAIQQELGDHRGLAGSLRVLGFIALMSGQLQESERLARESVAAFREAGDRAHAAEALINSGYALMFLGRLAEARSQLEESVAIYRDLGFGGSSSSMSLVVLSWVDGMLGRYDQARAWAQEALALARERGYRLGIARALVVLGHVAIAEGSYARAQQFFQPGYSDPLEPADYHLRISGLGYVARGLGRSTQARRHICKALRMGIEARNLLMLSADLPTIALLLVDQGEVERAVELYALASREPLVANAQWYEDVAGKHIAAAAATLPPDVAAAAQERGRARDLWATVEELLAELEEAAS